MCVVHGCGLGQAILYAQIVGNSVTSYIVEDLRPYTNYTIQVAAVNNEGVEGERSSPFTITTPEACESTHLS